MLKRVAAVGVAAGFTGLAGCLGSDGDDDDDESGEDTEPDDERRPVIFVHGGSGSATQFESQAMRFSSNGYPDDHLAVYEYDTSVDHEEIEDEVNDGLDERIDAVRDETGADQVDVIGHSRGTAVMHSYLEETERADRVANYVNVDGRSSETPPGDVRTLAVWGIGNEESEIGEAENVDFEQSHVEVATSKEAFETIYEFLLEEEPETTTIETEATDDISLSGRVAIFPENSGVSDGTVELYEIDHDTGERLDETPEETTELTEDGSWGPFDVDGDARYEFVLRRDDEPSHHFYRTSPIRSNQFVRLLTSEPGQGIDRLIERSENHTAMTISRDREWWGDGDDTDELTIDGTDIVTETTSPRDEWTISHVVYDANADGETDVDEPIPVFQQIPFLTGVDVHVPAADPPDDVVSVVSAPRGGDGLERTVNVPNWPSDDHRTSIHFPDHTQE